MPEQHADSPFVKWPGQGGATKKPSTIPPSLRTKRERQAQKHDALCLVNTQEWEQGEGKPHLLYCHCVCPQCWDKLARKCICKFCTCSRAIAHFYSHSAV